MAYRLYAAVKARITCRWNLDNCVSANAWWRTLKGRVLGAESGIPPFCLQVVRLFQIRRES